LNFICAHIKVEGIKKLIEMNEEMLTATGISTVMSSNLQFAQIINPLEVHLLTAQVDNETSPSSIIQRV
jgi:phosphotransferase system IIB component